MVSSGRCEGELEQVDNEFCCGRGANLSMQGSFSQLLFLPTQGTQSVGVAGSILAALVD